MGSSKVLHRRVNKLDLRAKSTSVEVRFRLTRHGARLTPAPIAETGPGGTVELDW